MPPFKHSIKLISGLLLSALINPIPVFVQAETDFNYTPIEKKQDTCACPCRPDFEIVRRIEFIITKKGDGYKLNSNVSEAMTYLSKMSFLQTAYSISEPSYLKVSRLKASFRGDKLGKKEIFSYRVEEQDEFFSEDKQHLLSLPNNIKYGDVLTIDYREEYHDIALLPIIEIPNKNYIKEFTVTFSHPKELRIEPEIFFPQEQLPYTFYRNSEKETVLEFTNVCKSKELRFFMYNEARALVLFSVFDNGKLVTPTSTECFVDWYSSLTSLEPEFTTSAADSLVGTFSGSQDVNEIREVYDFVRQNVRYISDRRPAHAFIPYSADTVFNRKYGDCKDKANLISALAAKTGLSAPMVIVSSHSDNPFSGIHPSQFNHVISSFQNSSGIHYFDPTSRYSTFNNLPEYFSERFGVIMNKSDSFRQINFPALTEPLMEIELTGDLNSLENTAAIVRFKSGWQDLVERAVTELNNKYLQFFLDSLTSTDLYKISFGDFELQNKSENGIEFRTTADLRKFIVTSGNRKYIPMVPFITIDRGVLEREKDDYTIHFPESDKVNLKILLDAPNVVFEPAIIELGVPEIAYFKASLNPSDSSGLIFDYSFNRPRKTIAKEDKSVFIDFCRSFLNKKADAFILTEEDL